MLLPEPLLLPPLPPPPPPPPFELDEPHALTMPTVSATMDAPPIAVEILPGIVPPV
jgi:hypothetical protein